MHGVQYMHASNPQAARVLEEEEEEGWRGWRGCRVGWGYQSSSSTVNL